MGYEVLRKLFCLCSETPDNGFEEGLNLSELYERIVEIEEMDNAFDRVLRGCQMEADKRRELDEVCAADCNAYELQGFINGFRICALLREELDVHSGGRKEKYPA